MSDITSHFFRRHVRNYGLTNSIKYTTFFHVYEASPYQISHIHLQSFTNYRHQTGSLKENVITVESLFYHFTPQNNMTAYFSKVYYNSTSPLNSEERVRSQVSLSGMCSAESGIWVEFSSRTLGFPCHYHSTNVPLFLIHLSPTLYNLSK